jgi:hypothetical protein
LSGTTLPDNAFTRAGVQLRCISGALAIKAAKNKNKKKHWRRFFAEKQEHKEAGTAKQGTEQIL